MVSVLRSIVASDYRRKCIGVNIKFAAKEIQLESFLSNVLHIHVKNLHLFVKSAWSPDHLFVCLVIDFVCSRLLKLFAQPSLIQDSPSLFLIRNQL